MVGFRPATDCDTCNRQIDSDRVVDSSAALFYNINVEDFVLKFEWDEEKNRINQEIHKISFETARHVFDDQYYIEMYDFEHSTADEDRFIIIGKVGAVLFVVYTERKDAIRLISARLATRDEEALYYDQGIYYD